MLVLVWCEQKFVAAIVMLIWVMFSMMDLKIRLEYGIVSTQPVSISKKIDLSLINYHELIKIVCLNRNNRYTVVRNHKE